MKISTLLVIYAVISLIDGIVLIFTPNLLIAPFGLQMGNVGVYITRILGAAMLGLAVLTWSTKNIGPSAARNAILLSLSSLVFLLDMQSGQTP